MTTRVRKRSLIERAHRALEDRVILPAASALVVLAILGYTPWWTPLALLGGWVVASLVLALVEVTIEEAKQGEE